MSQSAQPTFSDAPAPFDDRDADLIIRTSDGVHFRVYKSLLSIASTVFKDMFSLTHWVNDIVDDRPVVELTETSATIHDLLSLCFPVFLSGGGPVVEAVSQIENILEAAKKHDMLGIQKAAIQLLMKPQLLEKEPLRIYAIACQQRSAAVARLAALHTPRHELLEEMYPAELDMLDAGSVYQVLSYRQRCIEAAVRVAVDHTWVNDSVHCVFLSRNHSSGRSPLSHSTTISYGRFHSPMRVEVHEWWYTFMKATAISLRNSASGQTVRDIGHSRVAGLLSSATECAHCRPQVARDLEVFIDSFAKEVDDRISKVRLQLPFQEDGEGNK